MNLRAAVVLMLAASSSALAGDGVYRWTDSSGEVHYTNDLGSLPGDVVVSPVEGDDVSVIEGKRAAPQKVEAPPTQQQLEVARTVAETRRANAEADRALLAIRDSARDDEARWRDSFRSARDRIQALKDKIEQEKSTLEVNGLPVSHRVIHDTRCGRRRWCGGFSEDIEKVKLAVKVLERDLAQAEADYADLERRASYEAIPLEWRR